MDETREILELLREIREGQEIHLARQAKALKIQQEQFDMARRQFERAEALQDRAEKLQSAGANMMGMARKALIVVLPVIFVLLIYLTWLIMR
jgi:uncharacterized membrane protein (DUF106 family)